MAKVYVFEVTRETREVAEIKVAAETLEEAEEMALNEANSMEEYHWYLEDEPYYNIYLDRESEVEA